MNGKILTSLLVIGLVVGLAGGATFAYFFDTETSTGNTFAAGTLDLTVDNNNPAVSPKFTLTNLAPGSSGTQTWVLRNVGSLDGFIDLSAVTVTNAPGTTPEPEPIPDAGELGVNMMAELFLDVDGNGIWSTGDVNIFAGGAPAAINGMAATLYDLDRALLANSGTINLVLRWSIPTTVGNIIQDDRLTVGLTVELDQIAD